MRRVTRNLILAILVVVVLLLALGALPGFLKSGDPYYVAATPTNESANASSWNATIANTTNANATVVDASALPERSYPYTTAALADAGPNEPGRSEPYWKGPVGFKEAFTHSPFDEQTALRQQYPNATTADGTVRIARNGTLYRVAVAQ